MGYSSEMPSLGILTLLLELPTELRAKLRSYTVCINDTVSSIICSEREVSEFHRIVERVARILTNYATHVFSFCNAAIEILSRCRLRTESGNRHHTSLIE